MWMRISTCAGVIAALAGCGSAAPSGHETSATPEPRPVSSPSCPDGSTDCTSLRCPDGTTDCTQTNGTGVYTAEGGYAAIDTAEAKLMITHFINDAGKVGFDGVYYHPAPPWLDERLPRPGVVQSADYAGRTNLRVTSILEDRTIPTWTLVDPTTNTTTTLTGPAVVGLQLHIQFAQNHTSPVVVDAVLAFVAGASVPGHGTTLQTYALSWLDMSTSALTRAGQPRPAKDYCYSDAVNKTHPDPVVFQQGIDVDPVNGRVTRDKDTANHVTLSCYQGAPATVHKWGYPYLATGATPATPPKPRGHPDATFYFDAGIQMKRASYCGDATYHTFAGTLIKINDDWPFLQESPLLQRASRLQPKQFWPSVEACWTPTRATCINYVRHPELTFSFECSGTRLPNCAPSSCQVDGAYLLDGRVAP